MISSSHCAGIEFLVNKDNLTVHFYGQLHHMHTDACMDTVVSESGWNTLNMEMQMLPISHTVIDQEALQGDSWGNVIAAWHRTPYHTGDDGIFGMLDVCSYWIPHFRMYETQTCMDLSSHLF